MSSLWAIVPVKPLRRGKSRLSGVLTEEERTLLNYTMMANTVRVLKSVPEIHQVLVISRDPGALALAREFDARTVQEDQKGSDLNIAIKRATVVAQLYGAQSVLILPADLPMLNKESVQGLIRKAGKPPVVVIAPDRRQEGTNGLLISPAGLVDYQFGAKSLNLHIQQAQKYRVRVELFNDPAFALDLDVPEDLDVFRQIETGETNEIGTQNAG